MTRTSAKRKARSARLRENIYKRWRRDTAANPPSTAAANPPSTAATNPPTTSTNTSPFQAPCNISAASYRHSLLPPEYQKVQDVRDNSAMYTISHQRLAAVLNMIACTECGEKSTWKLTPNYFDCAINIRCDKCENILLHSGPEKCKNGGYSQGNVIHVYHSLCEEMRSGSDVKPRTPREQEIMETWAFFKGHIAHASHTSSQRFSSGHESSSSSTDVSGLSAASIQRRKQLKKRRSEPSAATDETSPPAASPTVPAAAAAAGASEAIINTTQILGSLLEAQRESRAESSEADDFGRMVGRSMKKLKQNQFHRCCIEIHQVIAKYQDAAEAPQAASPQQQQQLLPQKLPPQHQQLPHQQPPATPQWAANFSTPTRDATPGPWMRDLLSPYTGPSTSGYQTPSTSGYQTPFVSYPQTTSTPASATQSAGPSTSTPASITVSSPQKTFLHAVTCIDRSLVAPLGNPISPLQTPDRPDLKRIAEEKRLQNL